MYMYTYAYIYIYIYVYIHTCICICISSMIITVDCTILCSWEVLREGRALRQQRMELLARGRVLA